MCLFVASAQSNARWGAGGVLQFVHKGAIKGKLPPTSTGQIFRKVKLFRKLHGICIIVRKSRESRNILKVGARKGKKDLKTASIAERPWKDEIAIRLSSERKKEVFYSPLPPPMFFGIIFQKWPLLCQKWLFLGWTDDFFSKARKKLGSIWAAFKNYLADFIPLWGTPAHPRTP